VSDWELVERFPAVEDLNALRETVGWHRRDAEAPARALAGSLYGVCAVANGRMIGTARVVGDGVCVFYVQDVLVDPAHRRRGVATAMMERVMAFVGRNACEGAVVGLLAAKGVEELYERFGFIRRPNEMSGSGMSFFHRRG